MPDKIKRIPSNPVSGNRDLVSDVNFQESLTIPKLDANTKIFSYGRILFSHHMDYSLFQAVQGQFKQGKDFPNNVDSAGMSL